MQIIDRQQFAASRRVSNALASLIRSGDATAEQVQEYEIRDTAENAYRMAQPRKPWPVDMTCDELGLMP